MTAITAPDTFTPAAAHGVASRRRRTRSMFSEVREAQRQRILMFTALSTGIAAVTAAAMTAVVFGLAN